MLSKVFGVSVYSYENQLNAEYGVKFRARPGLFEITQHSNVILSAADDSLGTVGVSVVQRAIQRDGTNLTSDFLGGKRFVDTLQSMAMTVDIEGVNMAATQLKMGTTKAASTTVLKNTASVRNATLPDDSDAEGRRAWAQYLSAVVTFYSQLRSSHLPIVITDNRLGDSVVTVFELAALVGEGKVDRSNVVVKAEKGKFSEVELKFLAALGFGDLDEVKMENGTYRMKAGKDVFSFIGDHFREPPVLPVWTFVAASAQPPTQAVAQPSTSTTVAKPPSISTSQHVGVGVPESIIRDFAGINMNQHKEVQRRLKDGGLSQEARDLYESISKGKRKTFLAPLSQSSEGARWSFREAVALIAKHLGLEADEHFAEVVAARLVCAKGAFVLDRKTCQVRLN